MKTWIKRTLIGLFGASLLLGGFAACTHRHHHATHAWHAMSDEDAARMKARLVEKVGSRLELDAAQKERLAALADRLREQHTALVGTAPDPRAELRAMIAGPTFDRDKARALIEAKTSAVQSRSPAVVAALADFFDSLTPQQQATLRQFLEERRVRWSRG